ncbi:hypothetical protein B484DRAFT_454476 [Ochromonadaceae sp. CCMP2298]|nr:hypothetical protein B484DRAFT_454476 [Ochromonadaceae sp. CCMP2298]
MVLTMDSDSAVVADGVKGPPASAGTSKGRRKRQKKKHAGAAAAREDGNEQGVETAMMLARNSTMADGVKELPIPVPYSISTCAPYPAPDDTAPCILPAPAASLCKGNVANITWRAVEMSALRLHPWFLALPHPSSVRMQSVSSLSQFRQESWQWDALHAGRLTTSKAACCLGFYEPLAAQRLKVPRSLQGHGRAVSAWQQLRRRPPSSWAFLEEREERAGYRKGSKGKNNQPQNPLPTIRDGMEEDADLWRPQACSADAPSPSPSPSPSPFPFPFSYHPPELSPWEQYGTTDPSRARMMWGSVQEATALLAALNHFGQQGCVVRESGMFPAEGLAESSGHWDYLRQELVLQDILRSATKGAGVTVSIGQVYAALDKWMKDGTLPLLGASPDGILQHADGAVEVLEVKCSSPFVSYSGGGSGQDGEGREGGGRMAVSEGSKSQRDGGFAAWHVPQLQLEMLCVGSHCRSAVLVVLAVGGARLFRVQRDDAYLLQMLGLLRRFHCEHISRNPNRAKPPPPDFFDPRADGSYALFLAATLQASQGSELIATIPQQQVQRSPHNTQFFLR